MSGNARTAPPEVHAWIEERASELAELTAELIRFDTRSIDLAKGTRPSNEEGAAQAFVAGYLRDAGLSVEAIQPDPSDYEFHPMMPSGHHWDGRPMTLAHQPARDGSPGSRSLVLNGHIDVVDVDRPEDWRHGPFAGTIEDGRVYGRGASDMKGGLASVIFAIAALRASGVELASDIWVQVVTDEETNGMGTVAMAEIAPRPSAAVFAECTAFTIMGSCRGILLGRIELTGRAAHAEMPESHAPTGEGVNAISKLPALLGALEQLTKQWSSKHHGILSPPAALPTMVSAGEFPTTLASRAEVTVDITYLPRDTDDDGFGGAVRREVEEAVAARLAEDSWFDEHPPSWTWLADYPPYEAGDTDQLVRSIQAAAATLDRDAPLVGLNSWHDAATAGRVLGIPAVSFGPGDTDLAHTIDESIGVDELVDGALAFAALIVDYCGVAESR